MTDHVANTCCTCEARRTHTKGGNNASRTYAQDSVSYFGLPDLLIITHANHTPVINADLLYQAPRHYRSFTPAPISSSSFLSTMILRPEVLTPTSGFNPWRTECSDAALGYLCSPTAVFTGNRQIQCRRSSQKSGYPLRSTQQHPHRSDHQNGLEEMS